MTENEKRYRSLLASFDFYYGMSDDHSVWKDGQRKWLAICNLQKEVDPERTIMKEYQDAPRY